MRPGNRQLPAMRRLIKLAATRPSMVALRFSEQLGRHRQRDRDRYGPTEISFPIGDFEVDRSTAKKYTALTLPQVRTPERLVMHDMGGDLLSSDIFLFVSRDRKTAKALSWN